MSILKSFKFLVLLLAIILSGCSAQPGSDFLDETMQTIKDSSEVDTALVGTWTASTDEGEMTLVLNGDQSYYENTAERQESGSFYTENGRIALIPNSVTEDGETVSGEKLEDEEREYTSAYQYSVDGSTLTLSVPDAETIVLKKN